MKEKNISSKEIVIYNVKYYREKLNISQEDLSRSIGKKDFFIKNLEDGIYSRAINILNLDNIAKALGIDVQELFNEEKYLKNKQSDTE